LGIEGEDGHATGLGHFGESDPELKTVKKAEDKGRVLDTVLSHPTKELVAIFSSGIERLTVTGEDILGGDGILGVSEEEFGDGLETIILKFVVSTKDGEQVDKETTFGIEKEKVLMRVGGAGPGDLGLGGMTGLATTITETHPHLIKGVHDIDLRTFGAGDHVCDVESENVVTNE